MDFDALAQGAANVLVSSMLTDGWSALKAGFVQLIKKRDARDEQDLASDLEASRIAVTHAGADDAEAIRASAVRQWRNLIRKQVEDDPEFGVQWAALVEEVKTQIDSDSAVPQAGQYAEADRGARIVQIGRDSYGKQL